MTHKGYSVIRGNVLGHSSTVTFITATREEKALRSGILLKDISATKRLDIPQKKHGPSRVMPFLLELVIPIARQKRLFVRVDFG